MKHIFTLVVMLLLSVVLNAQESVTEGKITHDFVSEKEMKTDMLRMLSDFTRYMTDQWLDIEDRDQRGDRLGVFKGENTMGNDERGVRHNADFSMICAFLVKYLPDSIQLPAGITRDMLSDMSERSLRYAVDTHKAVRLYPCMNGNYWGSTAVGDSQWESSLWAMSIAYSAFFQWDRLSAEARRDIEKLLESECEYELQRDVPTGFRGDTKAEENGWEADVLAAALGLFPDNPRARQWFEKLRVFAVNSYSHPSDAYNRTVIDPEYDSATVSDLYRGANLFPDWTLQNHDLFHTSYQNVVMQELGEAALALRLFQTELNGTEKWKTRSLMHNSREVMDNVLYRLALADGELAMPNGNDWSLFLFDQITSYSTMACIDRDPYALLLENLAYKNIKARQQTTRDGSWLLRADVGARRMGVEAHRVMMTWLMHEVWPTDSIRPSEWKDFAQRYEETYLFNDQNIIRSSTPSRFVCFSWSSGLKSYTGYIASTKPDCNKIMVPFRANNTGNFLGWREVKGKRANAVPSLPGHYETDRKQFVMNGALITNDSTLDNRFALWATPGNAVIYLDATLALSDVEITAEKGGLSAISTDPFTREARRLFTRDNPEGFLSEGDSLRCMEASWVNLDNELGFITPARSSMAFGERRNNNSILTSMLYTLYTRNPFSVNKGSMLPNRAVVYLTSVDSETTSTVAERTRSLSDLLPDGWNGVLAYDPDGSAWLMVSNFFGKDNARMRKFTIDGKVPVLPVPVTVRNERVAAQLTLGQNRSLACELTTFVKGNDIEFRGGKESTEEIMVSNLSPHKNKVIFFIRDNGIERKHDVTLRKGETAKFLIRNGDMEKTR